MCARHRKPSLPPSQFLAAVSDVLRAPPIPDDDGGLRAGALFEEPARMDGMLFDASSVSCDADEADAIFPDDVEFHHGTDGLSVGGQVRKNTRRPAASCPADRDITHTVVPGTLRTCPIQGYGAMQAGKHRFDERGVAASTLAQFVSVWHLHDGMASRPCFRLRPSRH